jgi:hypothetical protein
MLSKKTGAIMEERWLLRFYLIGMIVLLLVGLVFAGQAQGQARTTEFVTNGELQDADANHLPDDWEVVNGGIRGDLLQCDLECWWKFGNVNANRGLRQFINSPDLTGITELTFSFRGKGLLTDSGGAGAVYVYEGGALPVRSHFVLLPVNTAFDQGFKIVVPVSPETTGFHIDLVAARAGSWSVTGISLSEASAGTLPAPTDEPTATPPPDPLPVCRDPGVSAWSLDKQRVIYQEEVGYVMKCYYNAPGDVFPPDTEALCPVTISNPVMGNPPYTEQWTRQKFATHDEPLRVRCVYVDYTIVY